MRRAFTLIAAVLAGQAAPAFAGLYTDDLTRCVVAKSTDPDKLAFIRWIFAAMSVHPGVKDLSKSTPEQRDLLTKQVSDLIVRLVISDCHAQSVAAVKYEGGEAIKSSFEILGRVAMQGLMSDPAVQKGMNGLSTPDTVEKFKALGREAGVPTPPTGAP